MEENQDKKLILSEVQDHYDKLMASGADATQMHTRLAMLVVSAEGRRSLTRASAVEIAALTTALYCKLTGES